MNSLIGSVTWIVTINVCAHEKAHDVYLLNIYIMNENVPLSV